MQMTKVLLNYSHCYQELLKFNGYMVERILKSFDLKFNSNNKNILANQKVEQPV